MNRAQPNFSGWIEVDVIERERGILPSAIGQQPNYPKRNPRQVSIGPRSRPGFIPKYSENFPSRSSSFIKRNEGPDAFYDLPSSVGHQAQSGPVNWSNKGKNIVFGPGFVPDEVLFSLPEEEVRQPRKAKPTTVHYAYYDLPDAVGQQPLSQKASVKVVSMTPLPAPEELRRREYLAFKRVQDKSPGPAAYTLKSCCDEVQYLSKNKNGKAATWSTANRFGGGEVPDPSKIFKLSKKELRKRFERYPQKYM